MPAEHLTKSEDLYSGAAGAAPKVFKEAHALSHRRKLCGGAVYHLGGRYVKL
jgi:hypothetical protein